ncbi:MAG: DNA polymerase IV [Oscillospiraceae bacterium]
MERVIFHCDCNSFFASVELLAYPHLRALPVAVCGSTDNRHGIILAKNDAAKKYGVATAETVWQAKRKCPNLTLLPPHHSLYSKYSKIINGIYASYTDKVEPFGIDESWLDMTGSWQLFAQSPTLAADRLRAEIKDKTGLTISVGVSFNKIFAKLGSDYKKPDATTLISRENYKRIVWPLPVGDLLFVGKAAKETLAKLNITNIGQLAAAEESDMRLSLGKLGIDIWHYARGEDDSPVRLAGEETEVKSVGNSLTFKRNLISMADVKTGASSLAYEVATRLRHHGLFACGVQIQIKDTELKIINRQKALPYPTHLANEICNAAVELISANWHEGEPIRMLSVTAISLTDGSQSAQTSLFDGETPKNEKRESLEESLDKIKSKYGKNAISPANVIKNDLGIEDVNITEN